eukprot:5950298-Alexandrium_andersonii.AAC.1
MSGVQRRVSATVLGRRGPPSSPSPGQFISHLVLLRSPAGRSRGDSASSTFLGQLAASKERGRRVAHR